MDINVLSGLIGAFIGALVAGIAIWARLRAASKERLEAIYERLLSELNNVARQMGGWDGNPARLSDDKKRTISRMLHLHLDSLVEAIAVEGRSCWRRFLYSWCGLGVGRLLYRRVGKKWFLQKHRYKRFEYWYNGILMLYNETLGASTYVEEVFHLKKDDPHKDIKGEKCLEQYFEKRLEYERAKGDG